MIGRLQGILVEKHPPFLLIDVNGVGYELQASMNTFYQMPDVGEAMTLHTHLIVREDAQILYGFHDLREREFFRLLIKINKVGPKMAIAILSSMDPDALLQCVAHDDLAALKRIPGVGGKTAERLLMELRDQTSKLDESMKSALQKGVAMPRDDVSDAVGALIALGYKAHEATKAISKIAETDLSSEELIRRALQMMV